MPTEASSETAPEESLPVAPLRKTVVRLRPARCSVLPGQQNLSQREVAETLHITMHYVNAIEHDEHDKLPGAVFAKGYIKRYAEIMALDETAVMAAYEGLGHASPTAIAGSGRNTRKPRRIGKSLSAVTATATVFISLFLGLWAWNGEDANTPAGSLELGSQRVARVFRPGATVNCHAGCSGRKRFRISAYSDRGEGPSVFCRWQARSKQRWMASTSGSVNRAEIDGGDQRIEICRAGDCGGR